MDVAQRTELIEDRTLTRFIRLKARQVSRRPGFSASDAPDVEQELRLAVWQGLGRYDRTRSSVRTFAHRLVERRLIDLVREADAQKRGARQQVASLDAPPRDEKQSGNRSRNTDHLCPTSPNHELERPSLRHDLDTVLCQLPADHQALCRRLQHGSIAEVVRETATPRSTIYERIHLLRERFREHDLHEYLPTRGARNP